MLLQFGTHSTWQHPYYRLEETSVNEKIKKIQRNDWWRGRAERMTLSQPLSLLNAPTSWIPITWEQGCYSLPSGGYCFLKLHRWCGRRTNGPPIMLMSWSLEPKNMWPFFFGKGDIADVTSGCWDRKAILYYTGGIRVHESFKRESRRLVRRKEDRMLGAEVGVMVFEARERSREARMQVASPRPPKLEKAMGTDFSPVASKGNPALPKPRF